MSNNNITFIGGGNMATSLISGLIADGYDKASITVSDPDTDKLANLAARCGVHTQTDNNAAITGADVVVLAIKPQVLKQVAQALAQSIQQVKPLVISIVAGVRESALQEWLGGGVPLVRSMPNTPAMIQSGATGLHAGSAVTEAQRSQAESILRAVGVTRWVENESQMDAVTAVSGSGPAYFFLVMEAIETSARQMGLDDDTARLLTLQTALGAARMALESSDSPALLREKVTSPGGTTERALGILEEGDIRTLFDKALQGAMERSIELSEMLGER
ncbi:MAG: pyrroline-5-carboxylate reductase [gamma proteobacterium symbiont of Ctena orbiculata]|uniref:Pyrroline-5-carboxylate reductase n=1 Tax=Candidatus Thiodiazotropha taylori TaxID=2792791 RepID=A0A944M5B6_9GAMM|nr:pyrroline-5-carboxylate reductase [Candidatus Thiodiazotropha taylori]PUB87766.1 MAG: pyrroline-5-carboxylate reductase [gamma proteobacterium symbiont of Ctena orbiculata]MBT2988286.1 pyrroline-5-carboxylate reductase [Candidatus Thiodiazotropha taylori]MBT2996254.1 pyrroline-5-carboxylate reductase [Candidatus Thiodiazotropha taylori]MBT2999600.1 pyrroline-5-carboxylate reductase [Candidatus Thiodiazotropha taylori]